MDWKGMNVTVKLTIINRQATVEMIPSASALIIKALNEPVRDRKKEKNIKHDGNITLDQVIEIARTMRPRSMARKLEGTVFEMLGTAFSRRLHGQRRGAHGHHAADQGRRARGARRGRCARFYRHTRCCLARCCVAATAYRARSMRRVCYRPLASSPTARLLGSAYTRLLAKRCASTCAQCAQRVRRLTALGQLVCLIHAHHTSFTAQTRDEWSHSISSVCSASRGWLYTTKTMRTRSAATSLRSGATGELKDYAGAAGCLFGTYRIPASLFAGASAGAAFAMPILGEERGSGRLVSANNNNLHAIEATDPFPQVREAHLRGAHDQLAGLPAYKSSWSVDGSSRTPVTSVRQGTSPSRPS